jgi:hypothetical protein
MVSIRAAYPCPAVLAGHPGRLLAADPGHLGPRVPCGQGHEAEFAACRDTVTGTAPGPVMLTRAWYHCVACGHGLAPRDAGPGVAGASLSPGLAAMNDKAAAAGPFARAAGLPEDLAGVRLTVKRAERAAEASGAAQAAAARDRATMITARKLPDTALGYLENNAPRMRCHWFRSRGLFAGSGLAGSGCKAVTGQRLKLSGMRWTIPGADAIITLRRQQASRPEDRNCYALHNQTPAA